MSWVEETLINAFCGVSRAAALDAAQMGALSTGSTAAAADIGADMDDVKSCNSDDYVA